MLFYVHKNTTIGINRKQRLEVIGKIEAYDGKIKELNKDSETYNEDLESAFTEILNSLSNITIQEDALKSLIAYALDGKNKKICNSMLTVLYDKYQQKFTNLFVKK